jgi:uncharacterized protein YjiS (DUF1127 family)
MTPRILTTLPTPVRLLAIAEALAAFARCLGKLPTALARRGQLLRLGEHDDHILADIGVTREDINAALSARFWCDPSAKLVQGRRDLKANPHRRTIHEFSQEPGRPAVRSPKLILAACNRRPLAVV